MRRRDAAAELLHRLPAGAREDQAARDRVRDRSDPARRVSCGFRACTGRRRAICRSCSSRRSRSSPRSRRPCSACAARSTPRTTTPPAPRIRSSRRRSLPRSCHTSARRTGDARAARRRGGDGARRVLARADVEAHLRHRRRAGREHRRGVRHPLRRLRDQRRRRRAERTAKVAGVRRGPGRGAPVCAPATGSSPSTAAAATFAAISGSSSRATGGPVALTVVRHGTTADARPRAPSSATAAGSSASAAAQPASRTPVGTAARAAVSDLWRGRHRHRHVASRRSSRATARTSSRASSGSPRLGQQRSQVGVAWYFRDPRAS